MDFNIVEGSLIARIGRIFMKSPNLALVIGKTIYLSGVRKEEFLKDERWLHHELVHVQQYKKYGRLKFLWLYTLESIRKGYRNNKFEIEARKEEKVF